jgi:NurA domain
VTLDFVRLAPRIDELVGHLESGAIERDRRLKRAKSVLETITTEELLGATTGAENANWLVAEAVEPIATRRSAPELADGYSAVATDGSSIDVNRHSPVACFVINIGHAYFNYEYPSVDLANEARLEFTSDRLWRGDSRNASKETVLTGTLLDAYRTALEMLRLADLVEKHADRMTAALLDGQFLLWGLKQAELGSDARELIFDRGVIKALNRLREMGQRARVAAGSYISRPSGREVTNALRLVFCPRIGGANCLDCPRVQGKARPCDEIAGGTDADLFSLYLRPGERSALFRRKPGVDLDDYYEDQGHGLRFFYLNVPAGEVARVELPQWVAVSQEAVDLLHAAVLDQCVRGGGYPLALQEAHEQAVIDGAARRSFGMLIDRQIQARCDWQPRSGKSWSKLQRPI